jgi:hypothetical protein
LSEILEHKPQVNCFLTRKRRDKPPELLSWHHTRPLKTLRDILSEQGRVYRATINGKLMPEEGARLAYQLRELRGTLEVIAATDAAAKVAAAEAAAITARATYAPPAINIVTVPSGVFVNEAMMQQIHENADSFPRRSLIEHVESTSEPITEVVVQSEPTSQMGEIEHYVAQAGPEAPAIAPKPAPEPETEPDPLRRRARELGFELLPRRVCEVD